jgi:hypothetical protein
MDIAGAVFELIAVEAIFLVGIGLGWLMLGNVPATPFKTGIDPAAEARARQILAGVLLLIGAFLSIIVARSNLLDGWDECVYIISARALLGELPAGMFRYDRPPLTSLLAVVFRPAPWIGTVLLFWGTLLLMWRTARALDLKPAWLPPLLMIFNGYLLSSWINVNSELPAILLICAVFFGLSTKRPVIVGIAAGLAFVARWNCAPLIPLALFFMWRKNGRRSLIIATASASAVLLPFFIFWWIKLGSPIAPLLANFRINMRTDTGNSSAEIYLFFNLVWPFAVFVPAIGGWVFDRLRKRPTPAAVHLALALAIIELAILPLVAKKDYRFLVPFAPGLYLAASWYILNFSGARRALIPVFAALIIYAGHLKSGWEEYSDLRSEYLRESSFPLIERINEEKLSPVYLNALPKLEELRLTAALDDPPLPIKRFKGGDGYIVSSRPMTNGCIIRNAGRINLFRFPCRK